MTHNLEVVGSSPTWSTTENQALTNFSQVPFFMLGNKGGTIAHLLKSRKLDIIDYHRH